MNDTQKDELAARLKRSQQEIERLSKILEHTNAWGEYARERLREQERALSEIHDSMSWTITAPLRAGANSVWKTARFLRLRLSAGTAIFSRSVFMVSPWIFRFLAGFAILKKIYFWLINRSPPVSPLLPGDAEPTGPLPTIDPVFRDLGLQDPPVGEQLYSLLSQAIKDWPMGKRTDA